MSGRGVLAFMVLLLALVASGVQVAVVSQEVRELHGRLEIAQQAQDDLLAEHSRLLLERSALSAYQNVERLAEEKLAMQFPGRVERIEP